jgi:hypothetical protein
MTVLAADGGMPEGLVAFIVVMALGVAAVFLFRSMSKHLRKVPKSFDDRDETLPPVDRDEPSDRG